MKLMPFEAQSRVSVSSSAELQAFRKIARIQIFRLFSAQIYQVEVCQVFGQVLRLPIIRHYSLLFVSYFDPSFGPVRLKLIGREAQNISPSACPLKRTSCSTASLFLLPPAHSSTHHAANHP
jgi:hypothetical protein